MSVLNYEMPLLNGEMQNLAEYQGSVVLIVNTASKCGFTPQYEGIEAIYQDYKDKGLVILGFPCNQFGKQEQGDASEIGAFCQKNYGVSFPMFSKIEVNGDNAAPLYNDLKRLLFTDRPVPSQVVLVKTLNGKGLRSICNKILVQICAKVGGIPWAIDRLPFTP